jgi:shikimate kinase
MIVNKPLCFVGISGAGKTTIGSLLAKDLKIDFIDLDRKIENYTNLSCFDYIETFGIEEFRNIELNMFKNHFLPNSIIALGAGIIETEEARILLKDTISIWLKADLTTCFNRINNSFQRPLVTTLDSLKNLYATREEYYSMANFVIGANQSENLIINDIRTLLCHK